MDQLVTLREATAYRYALALPGDIRAIEPAELFNFDDETQATGRLNTGETVGVVSIEITTTDETVYRGRIDIRSAKFADEQAFGTMLADLAQLAIEAMHQGFAPGAGEFGTGAGGSPRLLYQRFAVLHSLLVGSDLGWAISHVFHDPHREWSVQHELRPPGLPLRGSSRLRSQLTKPGPRVPTPTARLPTMPRMMPVERTEETFDTIPNRFVRFVLEGWRALAAEVVAKADSLGGAAKRRGVHQAQHVVALVDEYLHAPLISELARLTVLPGDNQVLRRREGYRQIYAAWALVEGTLGLELDLEDPLLVSRRNIATLYEYWTFTRLARALAEACGVPEKASELFSPSESGMSMVLKAGATTRLHFATHVGNDEVLGDLCFNQTFTSESWTRPMRPDASLFLRTPGGNEMWLHFDAKYRVDWTTPFGRDEGEDATGPFNGTSKRSDLLKMHAYRDAIRNSAGSYVLFPGSESASFNLTSEEFLPGLGAIPMRPMAASEDSAALVTFLRRAIRHTAALGTRHRRAQYWTARAYLGAGTDQPEAKPPVGALPPADTPVLLGYVRSSAQWNWIRSNLRYNLRSGDRRGAVDTDAKELDAPLILLYGRDVEVEQIELYERTGAWIGTTAETLERLGYPNPRGDTYLVSRIAKIADPLWINEVRIDELLPARWTTGRPSTTTWLDVVLSTQD
ncbi:DUF2357 domain-containing protein [Gordonia sp. NPDC058843]|uniref:DUF2357 domain-containing protein n=1 Tax=Gordonia sp. NPDC058843 TaxID=3346648 RepID=UPI0036CAE9AA